MTLPNGSASGNERLLHCPACLAFPRAHQSSQYAERGHGIHGYIRNVLSGTPVETALASIDDDQRETCHTLEWPKLVGDIEQVQCEVAYAIDVRARTARLLGLNVARDYEAAAIRAGQPLGEYEIPGSLDIEGVSKEDGHPVVIDCKSGFQDVTPADDNPQGMFFGCVKRLMLDEGGIEFRVAKIKPTGSVWLDPAVYTALDLDQHLDDLELALDRAKDARRVYLAGGTPDVSEGPWCTYCEAADHCPAKTRLARSMVETLAPFDVEGAIDAMTDEVAAAAYELVHDRVLPVAERTLEALKARARRRPYLLSDGRELREMPYLKDTLSQAALLALARSLGASEAQIRNCYTETTIRPVRALKPKGEAKPRKKGRAT